MIRGLEQLSDEDRLRELRLLTLEKRRARQTLLQPFHTYGRLIKIDGDRLFNRACSDRTRSDCFKLKKGRFRLDIGKEFFKIRVAKHTQVAQRDVRCPIPGNIQA